MAASTYLQQVARQPGSPMPQLRPTHALFQHWQTRQDRPGIPMGSAQLGSLTEAIERELPDPALVAPTFDRFTPSLPAWSAPARRLPPPALLPDRMPPSSAPVKTVMPEPTFLQGPATVTSRQDTNAPASWLKPVDTQPEPITANLQPAPPFPSLPTRSALVQDVASHPATQPDSLGSATRPLRHLDEPIFHPTSVGPSQMSDRHTVDKPQRASSTLAPGANRVVFHPPAVQQPAQPLPLPTQPVVQPLPDRRLPKSAAVEAVRLQSVAPLVPRRERSAPHPTIQIGAVEIRITPAPTASTPKPLPTITAPSANVRSAGESPAPSTSLLARGFGSSFGLRQS